MGKSFLLILILFISDIISAQNLVLETVDNSTLKGKAMFGYQGWFGHPDDKSPRPNYWHWGNMDVIGMAPLEVEMYPDMRELCANERYPTAYSLPNGKVAEVFSAGNKQTVIRHMKWVRDYNTDGVFIQRFISEYNDRVVMAFRDSTTVAVMEGCETYGRVFCIMYDGIAGRVEDIKKDWKHLVDNLEVTNSDRYLQHEGRPLVSLWGYTVRDDATVDQLEKLIDFFHNNPDPKYRASIKLGVNDNWFNKDQRWKDAFAQVEVISPWSVGRYSNQSGYNSYVQNQIIPGKNWCNSRGILFVPVLFPGFSWYNLQEGEPQNQIPRNGGNFFWMQAYGAIKNNVESLYFAMLDEVDEGTAIFKTAETREQAPAQGYWLNLDADGFILPSDWYLRCAGKAAETLRGNITNSVTLGTPEEGMMTIRPSVNDCKLTFIFPNFKDASQLEFSLDGGNSFPYSVADDAGVFEINELAKGTYNIYVRNLYSVVDPVPMGKVTISSDCLGTAVNDIPDNSEFKNISVYPNPTSSKINIEGLVGTYKIEIFNLIGNKCKSFDFSGAKTVIDISDLPNAIYLISIKNESGCFNQKINKIR
jgi:hypothetical protein